MQKSQMYPLLTAKIDGGEKVIINYDGRIIELNNNDLSKMFIAKLWRTAQTTKPKDAGGVSAIVNAAVDAGLIDGAEAYTLLRTRDAVKIKELAAQLPAPSKEIEQADIDRAWGLIAAGRGQAAG